MGMNINLTLQLEDLVRQKMASGLYISASELVREALRLMDEKDRVLGALNQLREDIREGLDMDRRHHGIRKRSSRKEGRARRAEKLSAGAYVPIVVRRPRASADLIES